jgi:O-antigen ligase
MNLVTLAAWCAALFLAATLFSHTVALRLVLLFAGTALVLAAALRARLRDGKEISFTPPLLIPFALWAGWAALSLAWTIDPGITRKELRNEVGYTLLAYWLCFVGAQAASAPRLFVAIGALGAVAVCAVALREIWFTTPGATLLLYGGPGAFPSTLLILLPCTLAIAWYAARRKRHVVMSFSIALLALYVVAGYAVQNRVFWFAVGVQIVLFVFLLLVCAPASSAPNRHTRPFVLTLAALAVAGAAVIVVKVQGDRLGATPSEMREDTRFTLWQSELDRIAERPLAGSGFGRGMLRRGLRNELNNPQLWHSHNQLLDTALQLGWTGLALLLLLLGWTAWLGWGLVCSRNEVAFACGFALLAVLAGMVIRNMTDVLWVRQSALLYWGAVGVLLAWGMRARSPAPAR